ncbi:uncharacterized protein LOC123705107 [Colias croceus]|uniref:uncharacterized protein LOC123705107 n=1 Tax=Colias crocea TaxID=72248 RepID=UPI001E27C4DE|nr:uncharacterized protein LOC123705107 [Colias croceus]
MFLLFALLNIFGAFVIIVSEKEKMPRYVVEEGVKPPIFGSYSYNPLTQTFDVQDETSSKGSVIQIQIYNKTNTENERGKTEDLSRVFRKNVVSNMPRSLKTLNWWPLFGKNKTNNFFKTMTTKKQKTKLNEI